MSLRPPCCHIPSAYASGDIGQPGTEIQGRVSLYFRGLGLGSKGSFWPSGFLRNDASSTKVAAAILYGLAYGLDCWKDPLSLGFMLGCFSSSWLLCGHVFRIRCTCLVAAASDSCHFRMWEAVALFRCGPDPEYEPALWVGRIARRI